MKRRIFALIAALALSATVVLSGCGKAAIEAPLGVPIASAPGNGLTASLSNGKGYLSEGPNEFSLDFRNGQGELVEVGAITLYFDMPAMGSMPYMKNDATLTTTTTPGIYRGAVTLEMKGTWRSRLSYQGPAGSGEMEFTVNAK